MTVSRIVNAVKLPAAYVEQALLIPDMQELARGARELVGRAATAADTSGRMLKASDYVAEVRDQVGQAAVMVQRVEAHATTMYGPTVGARQAGDAVLALTNIESDLAGVVTKRSLFGFGDTRSMGLDSAMQARIHEASDQLGELQAWTGRLVPRPQVPSRPPAGPARGAAFSHVPAAHAAAPAPRGLTAPPAAFSSPEELQAAVPATVAMHAPKPGFSSPEALDRPVKARGDAKRPQVAFSSPEPVDTAVTPRGTGKAAKLRFSNPTTLDVPHKLAPGSPGYGTLLFVG